MGDWCGPNGPTLTDEKQGRVNQRSHIPQGLKQGIKKKFLEERLCLFTCLLMGDPGPGFAGNA